MDFWGWASQNWFDVLTVFFGGGLWFTAFTMRRDARIRKEEVEARRAANLFPFTANHRELWKVYLTDGRLSRVRDAKANADGSPVTDEERVFVGMVVLQAASYYFASKSGAVVELDGWGRDVSEFLALPIPAKVWEDLKVLQNAEFIAFVDGCLGGGSIQEP